MLSVFQDFILDGKTLRYPVLFNSHFDVLMNRLIGGPRSSIIVSARNDASLVPAKAPLSRYHIWSNNSRQLMAIVETTLV